MCKWGTNRLIYVIRRNNPDVPDGHHPVYVDACIADYVQRMNDQGIITTACCCGHGEGAGSVLVAVESAALLDALSYEHHTYDDRDDVVEHKLPACDAVRMVACGDNEAAALLAHIDAQDAEIAALREAVRNLGGDPDQAWYWTDAWQAKEREADEDLRAGRYADADDTDTLLAD